MAKWTQKEVDLMLKMLAEGHSARDVGKAIGRTRCSVIGKSNKLKGHDTGKKKYRQPYLSEYSYSSWSSPRYKLEG